MENSCGVRFVPQRKVWVVWVLESNMLGTKGRRGEERIEDAALS